MDEPPSSSTADVGDSGASANGRYSDGDLSNAVSSGLYRLDRDGHLVAANDAFVDLLGYPRDVIIGEHASLFVDAENRIRAETAIRNRLLEGDEDTVRLTIPVLTADGDVVPCAASITANSRNDTFTGTAGVVREIADGDDAASVRAQAGRRLAFDALADASADGIVMLDDENTVRYANPAVERILGYEPDGLVGEPLTRLVPEHLRKAHAEGFRQYLETGTKRLNWAYIELPGAHRNGHEVPLAVSFTEFEHDGERYFVGTFRDISERKSVERRLERQNERLDQFASMLAHELRNPLAVAQARLALLDSEEATDQISTALTRIDEIIEVLLVLARGREVVRDRDPVDVAAVSATAWENVERGTSTLDVVATRELYVNSAHLQQLLENLFRNAVDHSPKPVTVRVGRLEAGFYVEDTGPGIPESERETVVKPGYTTDTNGIGLGLTFVSHLADAYGWTVRITESDEGGARFEFTGVEERVEAEERTD